MPASKNLLFLKKKKQKDFFIPGHGRDDASAPDSKKFFGSRAAQSFFQKRTASL
jgi:hypothetical protein